MEKKYFSYHTKLRFVSYTDRKIKEIKVVRVKILQIIQVIQLEFLKIIQGLLLSFLICLIFMCIY